MDKLEYYKQKYGLIKGEWLLEKELGSGAFGAQLFDRCSHHRETLLTIHCVGTDHFESIVARFRFLVNPKSGIISL